METSITFGRSPTPTQKPNYFKCALASPVRFRFAIIALVEVATQPLLIVMSMIVAAVIVARWDVSAAWWLYDCGRACIIVTIITIA